MAKTRRYFNVADYGADGDGVQESFPAFRTAFFMAAAVGGVVFIPAGDYRCSETIRFANIRKNIAVRGDGSNVSVIIGNGRDLFDLKFDQDGVMQTWGLTMENVRLEARGKGGRALSVSYGNPSITQDHYQPSVTIRNVVVASGPASWWDNGIRIEAAWNITMENVFVSGDSAGGNWNAMHGRGLELERMCVNGHFTNVRCNFWSTGVYYNACDGGNAEGFFFSNCSMVGVKRGVWITGNGAIDGAARMSTFVWMGGMIECRVKDVEGGSAAFHLVRVWTALISGVQMLAEALPTTHTTYGVFLDSCHGVVIKTCDINAWHFGVYTVGHCRAILVEGNTRTNCANLVQFNPGCVGSLCLDGVDTGETDTHNLNNLEFQNLQRRVAVKAPVSPLELESRG
jgi:hypothetical protein